MEPSKEQLEKIEAEMRIVYETLDYTFLPGSADEIGKIYEEHAMRVFAKHGLLDWKVRRKESETTIDSYLA